MTKKERIEQRRRAEILIEKATILEEMGEGTEELSIMKNNLESVLVSKSFSRSTVDHLDIAIDKVIANMQVKEEIEKVMEDNTLKLDFEAMSLISKIKTEKGIKSQLVTKLLELNKDLNIRSDRERFMSAIIDYMVG